MKYQREISLNPNYVFEHSGVTELWQYCIPKKERAMIVDYFIYFPDGYEKDEADMVIDVSQVQELRLRAVKCHESQKKDGEFITRVMTTLPQEEYFFVRKKS
jgi:LmbE family N-acetylglucosaminyl deacetylase